MAKQFTDRTIKALKPKKGHRYDKMDFGSGSVATTARTASSWMVSSTTISAEQSERA